MKSENSWFLVFIVFLCADVHAHGHRNVVLIAVHILIDMLSVAIRLRNLNKAIIKSRHEAEPC